MTTKKTLAAVSAADIHLSLKPPLFRSSEESWLAVQAGYLRQLKQLTLPNRRDLDAKPIPCLLAGDLYDKASVPHEVVNLAIRELPARVYSCCGNHDLPNHRLEDLHRSAYGVLVECGRITDLKPGEPVVVEGGPIPMRLHGFPYGTEIAPLDDSGDLYLEVALIHAYIWSNGTGYPGASEEQKVGAYRKQLGGFDVALFGDNHKPVQWNLDRDKDGPAIFNPGGFSIRKRDERGHRPSVGLIYTDGSIERHYLDISKDKYLEDGEIIERVEGGIGAMDFVEALAELADCALNFDEAMRRLLEHKMVSTGVKDLILKALEVGDKNEADY